MFSSLVSWALRQISGDLLEDVASRLKGDGDPRSAVSIELIRAEIADRREAAELRRLTSGYWEIRALTAVIAACFVSHLLAVSADTILKLGMNIPKYPAPFDDWEGAILLSFFAVQGLSSVARIVGGLIRK
jgi:hypothetical protein